MGDDFFGGLNESQKEAVLYNEGPSLVIAGAGSGKTKVLTCKIAYLLKNGFSPYNILALTFTNKAAREMKSRISGLLGDTSMPSRLWMGTFHSIFSRILRREAENIGFTRDFTIYDSQDSKNLVKGIVKSMQLDDKIYKPSAVYSRISRVKNALITVEKYFSDRELVEDDYRSRRPALKEIYAAYCFRCRASNVMDFDDLLFNTYLLFRDYPEILEYYRDIFKYILVDEYQDTNSAQHEIIKQLAPSGHRICVVGDDAQSIYSFRGADIGNILNFRNDYETCKMFKLERNYRSTKNIVEAANSLIRKNKDRIDKNVFSDKARGNRLSVIGSYSDMEEGILVARKIIEMAGGGEYSYGDFAVLYRTNAQSRLLEESLRKRNIPYKIYGGLSFYQRKEVKDILSYFRLIANPRDEESLKRIINYPSRGIGATTLGKILSSALSENKSAWEILCDPSAFHLSVHSGIRKKLDAFRDLILGFIGDLGKLDASEMGEKVLRDTGILSDLYGDKSPEGQSRVQNVEELASSLQEFVSQRKEEGIPGIGMPDFLSEISLLTDQDTNRGEESDGVTMMTVHAAKGLEFKNVFIVGLEEDLFPSSRSLNIEKEIEEERRLFYVAITRAEENCILTYAKSRFRNGQWTMSGPSRFIKEIDEKYLDLPSEISPGVFLPSDSDFSNRGAKPAQYVSGSGFSEPKGTKLSHIAAVTPGTGPLESHQSLGGLNVGDSILHERFGRGKITALEGSSENARATVEFENFGKKQLLLKFARFTVIK